MKGSTPELANQRNQLINIVSADNRSRKEKETNVIVIGLKSAAELSESETVTKFFKPVGLNVKIRYVQRFKSSKKDAI